MARVPVSSHQTAFWTAFDGSGRSGSPSRADGPNPASFPTFQPFRRDPVQETRISWVWGDSVPCL